jgi:hypothetical protein
MQVLASTDYTLVRKAIVLGTLILKDVTMEI